MRRLLSCLGLLAVITVAVPAAAYPLAAKVPVLTPGRCANVTLDIDFTAQGGEGLYCLNGTRYSRFLDMPGASFTRASSKTCLTAAGVVVTAAPGVPCITDQGYLSEESRTNGFKWSQDFDNAGWSKGGTSVTADQALAPDGTMTADAVVEDTSTGSHQVFQTISFVANSTNTVGIFVKPGSRTQINVHFATTYITTTGAGAFFTLTGAGSISSQIGGVTGTIMPVANGFYWITLTATSSTGNTAANVFMDTSVGGTNSYQGNGSTSLYLWQADAQAGAFMTSPIHTTSATVTRAADAASLGGLSVSGPVAMTAGGAALNSAAVTSVPARLSDGTINNYLQVSQFSSAVHMTVQAIAGGVTQTSQDATISPGVSYRSAITYDGAGRYQVATNGGLGTAATGKTGTGVTTTLNLGHTGGSNQADTYTRRVSILPRGLADGPLQGLTQ